VTKYGPRKGEITLLQARNASAGMTEYRAGKVFDKLCVSGNARLGKKATKPYAKCRYVNKEAFEAFVNPAPPEKAEPPDEPTVEAGPAEEPEVAARTLEPTVDPGAEPATEDWAELFAGSQDKTVAEQIVEPAPRAVPMELSADDQYSAAELAEILEDVPGFKEKPKASKALCKALVRRMKAHGVSNAGIDYGIMGAALAAIISPAIKSHAGNNRSKAQRKNQLLSKGAENSTVRPESDNSGHAGRTEGRETVPDISTAESEHVKNSLLDSYNNASIT